MKVYKGETTFSLHNIDDGIKSKEFKWRTMRMRKSRILAVAWFAHRCFNTNIVQPCPNPLTETFSWDYLKNRFARRVFLPWVFADFSLVPFADKAEGSLTLLVVEGNDWLFKPMLLLLTPPGFAASSNFRHLSIRSLKSPMVFRHLYWFLPPITDYARICPNFSSLQHFLQVV